MDGGLRYDGYESGNFIPGVSLNAREERPMERGSLHAEYVRKALEATVEERMCKDPQAKQAWERIAVGYLELAEMARRRRAPLL